jgi:hypothetical protein
VSRPEGHLSDPGAQERLRALDRRLDAIEAADLDELLRHDWGRRLYYRLVFEMCLLESGSFEPGIKDGIAAGLHMARNEGIREVGQRLAREAQAVSPELWSRMLLERIAGLAEEAHQREEAKASRTENDE